MKCTRPKWCAQLMSGCRCEARECLRVAQIRYIALYLASKPAVVDAIAYRMERD